MNTRLQVEHPVTEETTGIDLVEQMIRVAAGEKLKFTQDDVKLNGWSIEARVYAEDPYRGFLPSTGRLTTYSPPPPSVIGRGGGSDAEGAQRWAPRTFGALQKGRIRVDDGVADGSEICMFYDPMIAKLITWAPTRDAAIEEAVEALGRVPDRRRVGQYRFPLRAAAHPRFRAATSPPASSPRNIPKASRRAGRRAADDRSRRAGRRSSS